MGRWAGAGKGDGSGFQQLNVLEREIVRMASRRVHPFGISEIKVWLDVQRQTAAKLASMLLEKDWIIPHGLGDRGKQLYTLNRTKEILF
ncbi:MAG: hypothetical protein K0R67_2890 [Paenibacillus sp.]|nr:hypothetical protein [Paenibacillus sp.]